MLLGVLTHRLCTDYVEVWRLGAVAVVGLDSNLPLIEKLKGSPQWLGGDLLRSCIPGLTKVAGKL
jgi:hypothetical protein